MRTYETTRYMLPREIVAVETRYGRARVKVARLQGETVNVMPEYEDCRKRAELAGVTIKRVTAAAIIAFERPNEQIDCATP